MTAPTPAPPDAPAGGPPADGGAAPQGGQAPPKPDPKPNPGKPQDAAEGEPKMFPEAHVKQLRDEAAKHRTTAANEKAERDKLTGILAGIAKALDPEAGDKTDPEKLTQQLADRESALSRERIENAAYRAAGKAGANPDALLDSRTFLSVAHKLDPAGDSFTADLESAIKAAVEANPQLKATGQAPVRSVTDTVATPPGAPAPAVKVEPGMARLRHAYSNLPTD